MATNINFNPHRGNGLTERQKQLLKGARAQLNAIVEGPGAPHSTTQLYGDVLKLCGEIERLLGY